MALVKWIIDDCCLFYRLSFVYQVGSCSYEKQDGKMKFSRNCISHISLWLSLGVIIFLSTHIHIQMETQLNLH